MNTYQEQEERQNTLPAYKTPTVVSYDEEEILEELGPAQTGGYEGMGGVADLFSWPPSFP